jgi:hypothetical protein
MVRVITARKAESERQKAIQYVKTSIIYPSALLGLISLVLGYGALIYLLFKGRFFASIVLDSFILLGVGILLGWFQYFYQRFLFENYPEYYAERRRRAERLRTGQARKLDILEKPDHKGRRIIPFVYLVAFVGAVAMIITYATRLNPISAVFLLLAGFYNVRFFFWKRKLRL